MSSDKDQGLQKELPTTGYTQSWRIPKWLTQKYIALPTSASNPPFLHHISKQQVTMEVTGLDQLNKTVFRTLDCSSKPSIPSQYINLIKTRLYLDSSDQDRLVIHLCEAYWTFTQKCW